MINKILSAKGKPFPERVKIEVPKGYSYAYDIEHDERLYANFKHTILRNMKTYEYPVKIGKIENFTCLECEGDGEFLDDNLFGRNECENCQGIPTRKTEVISVEVEKQDFLIMRKEVK